MQRLPKVMLLLLFLLVVFNIGGWVYLRYRRSNNNPLFTWPIQTSVKATVREEEGKLYFLVPETTPLFASFTGKAETGGGGNFKADPPQLFKILTISAPDGRKLKYQFTGELIVASEFPLSSTSQIVVGKAGGEELGFTKGSNLILSLENDKGETVPLTEKMFKKIR